MKHYLICFDIQDDKVRSKLSTLLEKYGLRVQGSVFECSFKTPDRKIALEHKIKTLLHKSPHPETNVRFYNLSKETLKYCHDISGKSIGQLPAVVIL